MDGGSSPQPDPGWYPDPWTPSRRRYWNGSKWTFATEDNVPFDHPAPFGVAALPEGHGLPAPVARRPASEATPGSTAPAKPKQRPIKWVLAVVVGLLVGLVGVALSTRDSSDRASQPEDPVVQSTPTTEPGPASTGQNNDPSQNVLGSLVVRPADVKAPAEVLILQGGIGLAQPTLDLCDGRYPSEGRRTARVQDAVVDDRGAVVLSTEAVLYDGPGATTQAFAELRAITAACTTDRYAPPPDTDWPQTPTVNRLAYDFTSNDGSGPRRVMAVYLQRGRALIGVYFLQPEGPLPAVEGQTTVQGIVGVFAARLAALPASVVGA